MGPVDHLSGTIGFRATDFRLTASPAERPA